MILPNCGLGPKCPDLLTYCRFRVLCNLPWLLATVTIRLGHWTLMLWLFWATLLFWREFHSRASASSWSIVIKLSLVDVNEKIPTWSRWVLRWLEILWSYWSIKIFEWDTNFLQLSRIMQIPFEVAPFELKIEALKRNFNLRPTFWGWGKKKFQNSFFGLS